MALPIKKQQRTLLATTKPVDSVAVKLNWDANGADLDLMLIGRKKGLPASEDDVLFWGTQTKNSQGKLSVGNDSLIFMTNDNRTGEGDDDEVMLIKATGSVYDEVEVYASVYPPDGEGVTTLDEAQNAKLEFFLNGSASPSHYFNFAEDKYFGAKGVMVGVISVENDGHPTFKSEEKEFEDGLADIFASHNFSVE